MNRRRFLLAFLSGLLVYAASRLPWSKSGAVFKVTYVDPDGSGMDYHSHLGSYVYNAKRCCKNCEMIFAAWEPGGDVDNGPGFVEGELTPVNNEAKRVVAEIESAKELRRNWTRTGYAVAS